jgi:thiamine pyrophosphate-dependent acetolactate synthase large subunit-like protein
VVERRELLEIPPWPYANLARDWGGAGFEANTLSQLRRALIAADKSQGFVLIDVRVDRDDLSPVTVKYIRAAAKRSQAPRSRAATKGAGQ